MNKSDPTGLDYVRDDFAGPLQEGYHRVPSAYDTDGDGAISPHELAVGVEGGDPGLQTPIISPLDFLTAGSGALLSSVRGFAGRASTSAAPTAAGVKIFPKLYAQLQKQAAEKGIRTIEKTLRTMEKTLAAHRAKLETYRAAGGHTSAVEKTIRKIETNIATVRKFLTDKTE